MIVIAFRIITDSAAGVDCGDEAATWFQSYLKMDGVRLAQFFPSKLMRECIKKDPFMIKLRKNHPVRLFCSHLGIGVFYFTQ